MKRAVIMSVEAVLAAAILFSMLLIASQISEFKEDYNQNHIVLRDFSDGVLVSAKKSGALKSIISDSNDEKLIEIVNSLPEAVCTQVEIYSGSVAPANLAYSYTPQCEAVNDPPKDVAYTSFAIRSSDSVSYYWAKATSYIRG
jgi:hypothetical protein